MAKMTWELMLAKYERMLKAREKELYAHYKLSYRQLERDFKAIYDAVEARSDGQITLDEWSRELLHGQTAAAMRRLYVGNEKLLRATFNEIVETTRDRSIEMIDGKERLVGIGRKFDKAAIIDRSIAGIQWTDRLAHANANTRYDLIGITAGGIEAGETYGEITKKIAGKFATDYASAQRVARTEGHRIYETTKFETMESVAKEIQMYKTWHCVRDEKVRDTHIHLDGVQVKFDEDFESRSGATASRPGEFGVASEDVNCRCWVSYEHKEVSYDPWRPETEFDY